MSLTGFKAGNHPQQVAVSGADDDIDDRATHPIDFGPLNDRYGFTVDVAAAAHNTKCERFYDRETDGLSQSWGGRSSGAIHHSQTSHHGSAKRGPSTSTPRSSCSCPPIAPSRSSGNS